MRIHLPGGFRHAAATEHGRFSMNAIEARRAPGKGRVLLSATDGKVMALRLQAGSSPKTPILIPQDLVTTKKGGEVTQAADGTLHHAKLRGEMKSVEPIAATFPELRHVIPELSDIGDVGGALDAVNEALRSAEELIKLGAGELHRSDQVTEIRDGLRRAQSKLGATHHVVGLSGQLLYNLSRALNAGGEECRAKSNLEVALILPVDGRKPIGVLPTCESAPTSLGVIMPVNTDVDDIRKLWAQRRSDMLDVFVPSRIEARKQEALVAKESDELARDQYEAAGGGRLG